MLIERHRYDEMTSLYVNQLASARMNDSTAETIRVSFNKNMDSFAKGELEHAKEMLSALWEIINSDGEIEAPSNTPSTVSPSRLCFLLCCVGTLIITYFA